MKTTKQTKVIVSGVSVELDMTDVRHLEYTKEHLELELHRLEKRPEKAIHVTKDLLGSYVTLITKLLSALDPLETTDSQLKNNPKNEIR